MDTERKSRKEQRVFKDGRKKISLPRQLDQLRLEAIGDAVDMPTGTYVRLPTVNRAHKGGKVKGWKAIAYEVGVVAVKNLRKARDADATVRKFIQEPTPRRYVMDMGAMTDDEWYELLGALLAWRGAGRSRAALRRPRGKGAMFARASDRRTETPIEFSTPQKKAAVR